MINYEITLRFTVENGTITQSQTSGVWANSLREAIACAQSNCQALYGNETAIFFQPTTSKFH